MLIASSVETVTAADEPRPEPTGISDFISIETFGEPSFRIADET